MKPYPKYRDSGVEWLGDFPAHWNVKLLKRVCALTYGDALPDDYRNDGQIPVYGSNGIVGRHDENNTLAPSIIVGRKGSYGKLNYSLDEAFAIDTTYFIDAKTTKYNIRWLYYALLCLRLDEGSKDSAVPGLAREDAYKHSLPDCNILEQHAIAAFLDRETARIDSLIQKKERMIELLKEKRIALITQTVTKGLDPSVPMKDSGIEWLGKVPEHWMIAKVRYGYTIQLGKMLQPEQEKEIEVLVPYIKAINVQWDAISVDEETQMWASHDEIGKYGVRKGDLLVCEGGEVGRAAILTNDVGVLIIQNALHRVRSIKNNVEYLKYLLQVAANQSWFDILCNKATIAHFTRDKFSELIVPFPTYSEQTAIVQYLTEKLRNTKTLLNKLTSSITLLREYRASLIHHAVTGKIDLRGYDAQSQ